MERQRRNDSRYRGSPFMPTPLQPSEGLPMVVQKPNRELHRIQHHTTKHVIEIYPDRPGSPSSSISSETSQIITFNELTSNIQVLNLPTNGKTDTTLHFALDMIDDIEGQLEELGRLKRWGHFKEALGYFESNLEHHIALPMVKIEYADLLLEQGAYGKLIQLELEPPLTAKHIPVRGVYNPNLYRTHFDLIQKSARFASESFTLDELSLSDMHHFDFYLYKRKKDWQYSHNTFDGGIPFDYSEVQIIRNQLKLLVQIRDRDQDVHILPAFGIRCWEEMYNDLVMGGRIWEFCDLFNAMLSYLGESNTWKALYSVDGSECELKASLERLRQDWSVDQYDESTELAMLSILVHIMHELKPGNRYGIQNGENAAKIRMCLHRAQSHAANIQIHSPHLTRSRPYLQWIIAKECFHRRSDCGSAYRKQRESHFDNAFGKVIGNGQIPIYLPAGPRDIGWPTPDPDFPPNSPLKWVLLTSRELGDYETESMCLRELICRETDPRSLFAELSNLQRNTQGNNLAHFDTCLSQYLLANNDASRRNLIRELKEVTNKFIPTAETDICIGMRKYGLVVLCGLFVSFSEYTADGYESQNTIQALDTEISLRRRKTYTFELPPAKNEGALRRESNSQFRCQACLKIEKETQTTIHQDGADIQENTDRRGTVQQIEHQIQAPEPKQINRQATVTDFDEATTPPNVTHQSGSPIHFSDEEISDGEGHL